VLLKSLLCSRIIHRTPSTQLFPSSGPWQEYDERSHETPRKNPHTLGRARALPVTHVSGGTYRHLTPAAKQPGERVEGVPISVANKVMGSRFFSDNLYSRRRTRGDKDATLSPPARGYSSRSCNLLNQLMMRIPDEDHSKSKKKSEFLKRECFSVLLKKQNHTWRSVATCYKLQRR